MAHKGKPKEYYAEQAKILRERFQPRRSFTVRELGEELGYSEKSTGAALGFIQNLIKFGFAEQEDNGTKHRYYLVDE